MPGCGETSRCWTFPPCVAFLNTPLAACRLPGQLSTLQSGRYSSAGVTNGCARSSEHRLRANRHIVLAVRHGGAKWGALGLSREEGLQWKLLAFGSLGALLSDYREAYRRCGHEVTKVRIGLPMPHDGGYKGKVRLSAEPLLCSTTA